MRLLPGLTGSSKYMKIAPSSVERKDFIRIFFLEPSFRSAKAAMSDVTTFVLLKPCLGVMAIEPIRSSESLSRWSESLKAWLIVRLLSSDSCRADSHGNSVENEDSTAFSVLVWPAGPVSRIDRPSEVSVMARVSDDLKG